MVGQHATAPKDAVCRIAAGQGPDCVGHYALSSLFVAENFRHACRMRLVRALRGVRWAATQPNAATDHLLPGIFDE